MKKLPQPQFLLISACLLILSLLLTGCGKTEYDNRLNTSITRLNAAPAEGDSNEESDDESVDEENQQDDNEDLDEDEDFFDEEDEDFNEEEDLDDEDENPFDNVDE